MFIVEHKPQKKRSINNGSKMDEIIIKQGQCYSDNNGFNYWISKINKNTVYLRFSIDEGGFLKGDKKDFLKEIKNGKFKLIKNKHL